MVSIKVSTIHKLAVTNWVNCPINLFISPNIFNKHCLTWHWTISTILVEEPAIFKRQRVCHEEVENHNSKTKAINKTKAYKIEELNVPLKYRFSIKEGKWWSVKFFKKIKNCKSHFDNFSIFDFLKFQSYRINTHLHEFSCHLDIFAKEIRLQGHPRHQLLSSFPNASSPSSPLEKHKASLYCFLCVF